MMSENNTAMYMPVAPAYSGYGNGNGMFGDNGAWWLIVLFLFAMNGGWGNGYGANNGGNAGMQRGFDQQAVMSGIGDITGAVSNGFANVQTALCSGFAGVNAGVANGFAQAEVANNARQMANMNQLYGAQTAVDGRLDTLAMSLQNCCCENRAATADLKYTMATEAANTRANCDANNQKILDKLCQLELDGVRQNYEGQLRTMQAQLTAAQNEAQSLRFAASQGAQTAQILANNEAQTAALEHYLAPTPIPAYQVQNPNCCANGFGYGGCGCNYGAA